MNEKLSAVEERVDKLEESMEDVKESHIVLGECIDDLREDNVQEFLNSQKKKLRERNNALKAMVMALKAETMSTTKVLNIRIKELEGELALCRATVRKGVSSVALKCEDVPKPKEFAGTRSAYNVDSFLWMIENYFCAKGIMDNAIKVNTASMFLTNIALLWWRGRSIDKT
ncbi:hypothetical protein J1N35_000143 [Gossypium stocksii]|uniref:Uncharacterized protein n=1 Tax=Gossypium stocksii TaxID=47602 RepID=A0A9D3WH45_9ROSI|nr:hypothetical protein J1N35_000143 [Gossypium stocksii]